MQGMVPVFAAIAKQILLKQIRTPIRAHVLSGGFECVLAVKTQHPLPGKAIRPVLSPCAVHEMFTRKHTERFFIIFG